MTKRKSRVLTAAMLFAACSSVLAVENVSPLPRAADELMRMYPGSQVHKDQDRVRIIYGVPMTPGLTPRDAAQSFIQMHGEAFGCGQLAVAESWSVPFKNERFTVFAYQQSINGVPVEYGNLRVLVLNAPVPQVVYAAGTLAPTPESGLPEAALDGKTAVQIVRAMKMWKAVPQWSEPELVVFQGNGQWQAPVLAWKFIGEDPDINAKVRKTFFVNAQTGALTHVRDEILYADVQGSIRGNGSPGVYPDESYNPPALINIPDMKATIAGGNNAFTDGNGLFTILNPGTAAVNVSAGVNAAGGGGRWVSVVPTGVGAITASANGVTPPGPADLVFNPTPSEFLTAQVNAFVCTSVTHNYFKQRAPGFGLLDIVVTANTGVSGTCNAFYTGTSINFYNRGGGCANTAFSTVVSHEYGHFIVNRLGLAQNAFGEGYGDVTGAMIWDDAVTGRGFRQTQSSFVRDPIGANVQYPCSGEIHFCGQVIGGVWWRIRENMGAFYGSQLGLDETRQLQVDWSLITNGGPDGSNSAGPGTAIEVLTVDDNDGNLGNGTPNYTRICAAFAAHSIQCPALTLISFQYPNGRPSQTTPNQPTNISVNVVGVSGSPQPGTGTLSYRIGGGSFTTVPMTQGNPNEYTATLPAAACGQALDYYFGAQTTAAQTLTDPPNAPTGFFSAPALAGVPQTTLADYDFNAAPSGWTVTNDASLTTGAWGRGIPVVGNTNAPTSDFNGGGQCWLTDNRVETGATNYDIDGGPTNLTTEAFDLSGYSQATVSFARWFVSTNGVVDTMPFQVSSDNGTTWTTLETATSSTGWVQRSFSVPVLSSQVRFRWSPKDNPNDSVTEAAVDAFKLVGYACTSSCYANCDGSTAAPVLNVNDFICFQAKFAAGDSYANCDGSTAVPVLNVNDFICFQQQFASGCP